MTCITGRHILTQALSIQSPRYSRRPSPGRMRSSPFGRSDARNPVPVADGPSAATVFGYAAEQAPGCPRARLSGLSRALGCMHGVRVLYFCLLTAFGYFYAPFVSLAFGRPMELRLRGEQVESRQLRRGRPQALPERRGPAASAAKRWASTEQSSGGHGSTLPLSPCSTSVPISGQRIPTPYTSQQPLITLHLTVNPPGRRTAGAG